MIQEEKSIVLYNQSKIPFWCDSRLSEAEVNDTVLLCFLINSTKNEEEFMDKFRLEKFYTTIFVPILEYKQDEYVVVQNHTSIICAIFQPNVIWDVVMAKEKTYAYGGLTQKSLYVRSLRIPSLKIYKEHSISQNKKLILCGHSIAGSLAQLCAINMMYSLLPVHVKESLDKNRTESSCNDNLNEYDGRYQGCNKNVSVEEMGFDMNELRSSIQGYKNVFSIGFGSIFIGNDGIRQLVDICGFKDHLITVVNENDCIPGILNIAQTSTLLANSARRGIEIARATRSLLQLLPLNYGRKTSSLYANMAMTVLDSVLGAIKHEALLYRVMGTPDYVPCGIYVHLNKAIDKYKCLWEVDEVFKMLQMSETTINQENLLQHKIKNYFDNITRRMGYMRISSKMNYYERLNISQTANLRDIRNSYRINALKWHPDKWSVCGIEEQKNAETTFKLLAEAYEVLSDPACRKNYDDQLSRNPSVVDEFQTKGTVYGMTLDEALNTFTRVVDQWSVGVSHLRDKFISSSSTAISTSLKNQKFVADNHSNLFAQGKMRISRSVNKEGEKLIMFVDGDEFLPGDVPAPSARVQGSSVKAMSVVGGAIVVGAGISLLVGAWSQYEESTRRQRQADAVHKMPPEFLCRLLMDNESDDIDNTKKYNDDSKSMIARQDNFSILVDKFYDCYEEVEDLKATLEAEDEFFDCVELEPCPEVEIRFPIGAMVETPFGLGKVKRYSNDSLLAKVEVDLGEAYIQEKELKRGSSLALSIALKKMEESQKNLVDQVLQKYGLEDKIIQKDFLLGIAKDMKDGVFDNGMKASSGVIISKAFSTPAAASLAIASILVDIGKDYLDYCNKLIECRDDVYGNEARERLLMEKFRASIGLHVVSGSSAAAGAGIGAFSAASIVTAFTGAATIGPVGILAATGAALLGGAAGYFTGSAVYHKSLSNHFNNISKAKEDIQRLEIGAKVLFYEVDKNGSNYITRNDCKKIIHRLQDVSGNIIPDESMHEAIDFLEKKSNKMITFQEFWEWVSIQALLRLENLEEEKLKKKNNTSLLNEDKNVDEPCSESSTMYPVVFKCLGFKYVGDSISPYELLSPVVKTQVEFLVFSKLISSEEAQQLSMDLESNDDKRVDQAWSVIDNAINSLSSTTEVEMVSGFEDDVALSKSTEKSMGIPKIDEKTEQLDVICSLLSSKGIAQLLTDNGIRASPHEKHEDLHFSVLAHLAPRGRKYDDALEIF